VQPTRPVSEIRCRRLSSYLAAPLLGLVFAGTVLAEPTASAPPPLAGGLAPGLAADAPDPQQAWKNTLGMALSALPSLGSGSGEFNLLPRIQTVYPTGEKPLVVLTFKCPTEMVGITTPPITMMREALKLGFEGLNRSNLLPFNLEQVCM